MNVLHICSEKEWRGGEQQLAYLIEELNKHTIQQWVLCLKSSTLHKYCVKQSIPHYVFEKSFVHQIKVAKQVKKLCEKFKIDLLHTHDSHAHNFAVLASDFFGNTSPIVVSRKVNFATGKSFFSNYKYNHEKIKKIICVSEAVKNTLSTVIRDTSKLVTIYDCIDLQQFKGEKSGLLRKKYNIPTSELIIGNIAALSPEKDYVTFVETAQTLLKKGIQAKFIIVGTGSENEKLNKIVADKHLTDSIIFHGFADNVPVLIKDFDFFLFTSKAEGLGSIVLAAFASHVPVVATNAGGTPELVKHKETGMLAPVGNAQELAAHITFLIESPELKEKTKKIAYEFVQQFSKEVICKQVMEVYQSIL